jgi:hypothetical protein
MIHREPEPVLPAEDALLVVAYHTPHAPYRKHAREMKLSAEKFGLNVLVEEVPLPASADWHECVYHKPLFLRNVLWQHDLKHVLFVDVDARFRLRPLLFLDDPSFDMSYHVHQWSPDHEKEHISAVMFFHRDMIDRHLFAEMWRKQILPGDNGNQPALKRTFFKWQSERGPIDFLDCGPEHFWIYDRFAKLYPDREPVIEHFQESRKARNRHLNK